MDCIFPASLLGDDLPKQNPWVQDRLNYAPFASRIAKVVTSLKAPNGYVIGIHGQWGTGKSTAINFILAYLNKHNAEHEDDQVIHIDFRPWIVSGHQDLITAFFKILSERLGPKQNKWVRFWRRTMSFVHGTTDNLVDAAASDAIPKAVVNELMSKLDSVEDCERIIRAYMGRTNSRGELMIAKLLDEVRVQFRHPGPAVPQQGLLDALFRVGEEIISIDRDAGMFELSPGLS